MFTEEAIYDYILNSECGGSFHCADELFASWQQDTGWWLMLLAAEAGDLLYGEDSGGPGTFRFFGEGQRKLTHLVAWGGKGPSIRLSSLYKGQYAFGAGPITSHSAGWEVLVFHDSGYAVTKAMFYSAGEQATVYGSQYAAPTLASILRAGASAMGEDVAITNLSRLCGKGENICGMALSAMWAGVQEAMRKPSPEQGDLMIETEHWRLHYKPNFLQSSLTIDINRGELYRLHSFYPPFIQYNTH